jgi:hypothetical protein
MKEDKSKGGIIEYILIVRVIIENHIRHLVLAMFVLLHPFLSSKKREISTGLYAFLGLALGSALATLKRNHFDYSIRRLQLAHSKRF